MGSPPSLYPSRLGVWAGAVGQTVASAPAPESGPGPLRIHVLALVLGPLGPAHGGETCNKRFFVG